MATKPPTKPPYEILRDLRQARCVSGAEMARRLSMDKSQYLRLERGERRYLVEDAIAAAKFLGVSVTRVTVKEAA